MEKVMHTHSWELKMLCREQFSLVPREVCLLKRTGSKAFKHF